MPRAQEVTYIPDSDEIRATITVGTREMTTSWPLDSRDEARKRIDTLNIHIQQVTFLDTPSGGEIDVQMAVGDRIFVSRIPIAEDDQELKLLLGHLLETVGEQFMSTVQSALHTDSSSRLESMGQTAQRTDATTRMERPKRV